MDNGMRTGQTVKIHLTGETFSGDYVADLGAVSSLLTDSTHRQLVRLCCDYWPEMTRTAAERKELRRLPAFVLAVICRQL